MKIAIFSDCFLDLTGGIVTTIKAQKAELEKRGHVVYVFSTGFPRKEQTLKKLARENVFMVPSCRLFFRGLTPISRRPAIIEKWILRKYPEIADFDIFYVCYEAGCSIAGLRLGKRLRIPTVQAMHGREDMGETNIIPYGLRTFVAVMTNWFHSWYLPHPLKVRRDNYLANSTAKAKMWTLMVNHANYANLVITPTAHFGEKLKHYGVLREIIVVPNGVSDELVDERVSVRKVKDGRPLKIIWHSRVSAEKRMMPFLSALVTLPREKYILDVYGGGGDFFRARRFAKQNRIPAKFHGNAGFKKIWERLLEADLDVLVSYNFDTFGMTLIEAEAAGAAVFFVDPDMQEIVPKGGGILATDPTPAAMTETLRQLLNEPKKIEEMSAVMLRNRENVRVSKSVDKLERVFREMNAE